MITLWTALAAFCRPHAVGHPMDKIDANQSRLYIGCVSDNNHIFEQELKRLETRMDDIVRVCDQLKEENRSLKARQDTLISERASLLQKNELVRGRVEAMIGRLKAMESGQ